MKTDFEKLSYAFALSIIAAYAELRKQKFFELGGQLIRSGTAVGALYSEAKYAQSRADFINKLSIARKECNECLYWLNLLHDSGYLSSDVFQTLHENALSLLKILTAMIRTSQSNLAAASSPKRR
jgi:four helix bundle protein